ncbi:MAG: hypothetical protein PWQ10_673 [Patescibacteria group bacterium]|nr:hypothetical protein [Patescibacteria group bacterium]
MKKRKLVIFIALLLTIISLAIYIYIASGTYLKFTVAPQEVYVSIDNKDKKQINNKDSINIEPGKHSITISQDEFKSYTEEIEITKSKTNTILVALTPLTDNARNIMKSKENIKVIEPFEAIITAKNAKIIKENYSIIKDLPVKSFRYQIYGCKSEKYPDDSTKVALCISYTDGNEDDIKQTAFNRLEKMGYNPSDYEIIIKESPDALKGEPENMPK